MSEPTLVNVLEVVLLGAGRALKLEELVDVVADTSLQADRGDIRTALKELGTIWESRGMEMSEVATGFRLQVRADYAQWMARLMSERPTRYSRALLETLALIAYRQPITRGEIEDVRGVSVSASIVRTLLERDWVRVLGHREVPGRPAIYGTTKVFLDDFDLKGLEGLPPLADVRDIDRFHADLFGEQVKEAKDASPAQTDGGVVAEPESSGAEAAPDAVAVSDSDRNVSAADDSEADSLVADDAETYGLESGGSGADSSQADVQQSAAHLPVESASISPVATSADNEANDAPPIATNEATQASSAGRSDSNSSNDVVVAGSAQETTRDERSDSDHNEHSAAPGSAPPLPGSSE